LRRIVDFPQHRIITDVLVNGRSCTATTRYVLKPGFRQYAMPRLTTGEMASWENARVISSSCTIGQP